MAFSSIFDIASCFFAFGELIAAAAERIAQLVQALVGAVAAAGENIQHPKHDDGKQAEHGQAARFFPASVARKQTA